MKPDQYDTARHIDAFIRQQLWCDFTVFSYTGSQLILHGGTDLLYTRQIAITFNQVFGYFGVFDWKSDTSHSVFDMPLNEELRELNRYYNVEQGYSIYRFHQEDNPTPIIIIADSLNVDMQTVTR